MGVEGGERVSGTIELAESFLGFEWRKVGGSFKHREVQQISIIHLKL